MNDNLMPNADIDYSLGQLAYRVLLPMTLLAYPSWCWEPMLMKAMEACSTIISQVKQIN